MGDQTGVRLSVNPELLTDSILKILLIEERIEEKLDKALARASLHEATISSHLACMRAVQAMPENDHASFGDGFRNERNDTQHPSNQSYPIEAPQKRKSVRVESPGIWLRDQENSPIMISLARRNEFNDTQNRKNQSDLMETRQQGVLTESSRTVLRDPEGSPIMNSPGSGAGVQMRSTFQVLIDEQPCEDGKDILEPSFPMERRLTRKFRLQGSDASGSNRFSDYIPIDPNSPFLVGWSIVTILVLFAELTYVPYVLAWDVELYSLPIYTLVFWSLDSALSFISGTNNAEGEKNPIRVSARAYALGWFPLDFTILVVDWVGVFGLGGDVGYKMLRFSKLGRMWRLLAVLRLSKLSRNFNRIMDTAPLANGLRMTFRVVYLSVSILWVLHLLACSWFLAGKIGPTDTGRRWLDVLVSMTDGTTIDISTCDLGFQYVMCFHWSVATFTLGSMEIGNSNSFERLFVVGFYVLSFLFGSVLISLLSAIVVDHQMQSMETLARLRIVDRFLGENEVSNMLALRVQKVCLERLKMKDKLTFSDTIALQHLPTSLYKELRYEIVGRFLKTHDLFNCWSNLDISVAKDFSVDGVDINFLKPGDELFKANDDSENAYLFSSGELTYSKNENDSRSNVIVVPEATWLSEAALWSHWRHVGTCEAKSPCKVAVACYKNLAHHLQGNRLIRAITLSYCQLFCQGIALARPPNSEFPDDMRVPLTKFAEMLMHFPDYLRISIGTHAINLSSLGSKTAANLLMEVNAGKCDAYINIEGELERIVVVVVLMLQDDDSRVLYQIGKAVPIVVVNENGEEEPTWKAVPELKLPGLKHERGEFLGDTLKRLVDKKFNILEDKLEHTSTVVDEEIRFSKEFGVKTRYLRAKMVCKMLDDFPAKPVCRENETSFADTRLQSPKRPASRYREFGEKLTQGRSFRTTLSAPQLPLFVIFDGNTPFIYAWLGQEAMDILNQSSQHRLDDMLNQMLGKVNFDVIEQGPYVVDRLV